MDRIYCLRVETVSAVGAAKMATVKHEMRGEQIPNPWSREPVYAWAPICVLGPTAHPEWYKVLAPGPCGTKVVIQAHESVLRLAQK